MPKYELKVDSWRPSYLGWTWSGYEYGPRAGSVSLGYIVTLIKFQQRTTTDTAYRSRELTAPAETKQ